MKRLRRDLFDKRNEDDGGLNSKCEMRNAKNDPDRASHISHTFIPPTRRGVQAGSPHHKLALPIRFTKDLGGFVVRPSWLHISTVTFRRQSVCTD